MPTIRQLPPSVVNKIAAGEVVERPASIVKELLENAIDAGATRVDVALEQGGVELVRVADNGCGIAPEQLPLAVASHATSKIEDADDLFAVRTLGFRGEALASIAEVSHFLLRSRVAESAAGAELEVVGGVPREVTPCGCPVGTTLEVRNLFFNTPVRRRFLRSTQTEVGHATEAFLRIALACPQVHLTFRHNERVLYELPAVENWRERILACFRGELGEGLLWIDNCDGELRLSGYVGEPSINRANNRFQYLFLNGRFIRDKSLQHALGEAYRGLLMVGRFPVAFLRLEIPPAAVDVNVHPTKLEVRFQDGGRIYSQLLGTLRQKFLATDLTARVHEAGPLPPEPHVSPLPLSEAQRRELVDWARTPATASSTPVPPPQRSLGFGRPPEFQPFPEGWPSGRRLPDADRASSEPQRGTPPWSPTPLRAEARDAPAAPAETPAPPPAPAGIRGLQVQNRYLVTESDEGMIIIDQHALHERVLYEQLRSRVLAGALESQRLLVPEPVHLSPAEAAAALDARELLAELGIEVEPFGGDTVLVNAYPAMLANLNPAEMLRQVVEQLLAGGKQPERRDLIDSLLHMIACKAAIKAGDRLTPEEIEILIQQRHLCQDAHHCPHGRPTALIFTRDELDRRFKRT